MIFSELYGSYYHTVAQILKSALSNPISKDELQTIIKENAFAESILSIEPALLNEDWQLLLPNGTTELDHIPTLPLTLVQKQWLKAISLDPRIRLFSFDASWLEDVEPLFVPEDIFTFDRCLDGDPYEDETYIHIFHQIMEGIKQRQPLFLYMENRTGQKMHLTVMPEYLEYSEKDDKFRLITSGCKNASAINLGRILSCEPFFGNPTKHKKKVIASTDSSVVIELYDERKALERVMLHFAHFEKEAIQLDEKNYKIIIKYRIEDETEMVIRILSFGPFLKVTEPEHFVDLIKTRLKMQKDCGLN